MTDVTSFTIVPAISKARVASVPSPAPQPVGPPVLISDCTSPLAGETLLSLLWKRCNDKHQDPT